MPRLRKCVSLALIIGLAGAGAGHAQEKDQRKSAELQVWAIRATTKNKDISPELRSLAERLQKQFKFTGFKLERREKGQAAIGKTFQAGLIGGYAARLTPQKNDGKKVTLKVEILREKDKSAVSSATVTIDAATFQPIGGPALDGGDTLIVAVSAR